MEKLNEEAVKSLIQLREINAVRVKGYQNAVQTIRNGNLKKYFQIKINEMNDFTDCIDRSIMNSNIDLNKSIQVQTEKIHQSQFYFTMAMSSTNPRTVALSCQLGDKFAEKAYESTMNLLQFLSLPELLTILGKHISNLRKSFDTTKEVLDTALV
ncbi:hypothetical protein [Emticicia sp. 17c]|uniref:hypothetical protein n=1 Tax=Emticicia sp. 17c TaxID=3127704 RepID=UPI00301CE7C3